MIPYRITNIQTIKSIHKLEEFLLKTYGFKYKHATRPVVIEPNFNSNFVMNGYYYSLDYLGIKYKDYNNLIIGIFKNNYCIMEFCNQSYTTNIIKKFISIEDLIHFLQNLLILK